MKRIVSIIIAIALILTASAAFAKTYKIGIGQFAQHGSLDNCYEGFVQGLTEAGLVQGKDFKVDLQNAQADMGIAQQIAAQFASGRVDMMVGIATPMAQACYNAASGFIPTIFTAVTDPIAAGFADASGKAAGEVTGTSDALPIKAQLETIRAMLPDAKKVGITPDKEAELIEDLKKRTGLDIQRVEVGAIDFAKDTAMVKIFYEPLSNEVNSVNHVGRLPKAG